MQTFSYKGRAYKRMPELASTTLEEMCVGCKFTNKHETLRSPGCAAVKEALGNQWCGDTVWIPDTKAGLAKYIALKLERS